MFDFNVMIYAVVQQTGHETQDIICKSLTQIGLQIPRWRTKWHINKRIIQNSIALKASAYVIYDIRQVAALVDLSRNKTRIQRQEILDIRQVTALNFSTFWGWVAYVHMCVCCCTCMAYVCAYVRENVIFEVYGGECESISNQYASFFSRLLSIVHFAV